MHLHKYIIFFEPQDLPQEPSLTSTNVSSLTHTQAINCIIQNDINELKEILNLQKQMNALQNNMKQSNVKQNTSNKVTLQQVTAQGKRK